MNAILRAEMSMDIPNTRVIALAGRLAGRSERVQVELKLLTDPDSAA